MVDLIVAERPDIVESKLGSGHDRSKYTPCRFAWGAVPRSSMIHTGSCPVEVFQSMRDPRGTTFSPQSVTKPERGPPPMLVARTLEGAAALPNWPGPCSPSSTRFVARNWRRQEDRRFRRDRQEQWRRALLFDACRAQWNVKDAVRDSRPW